MAENQVQIEVELVGQKEVGQGLEKITKGAEGVGNTFKSVGDVVGKTNQQLGEGLSSVSDALGETMNAVGGVKEAFSTLGTGGAMSFTSLLGPVSLVITALGALYETYRQLSGAAKAAEDRQEAMAAAASDLSSKLEALSEGGVVPTVKQLERFARITLETQVAKELLIKKTEKLFPLLEKERTAAASLAEAQAQVVKSQAEYGKGSDELSNALRVQYRAEFELSQVQAERAKKTAELAQQTAQNLAGIAEAAEQEQALEEQTTDNLRAKFKENAERLKTVELLRLEAMGLDELLDAQVKDNIETEHSIKLLGIEDKTRAELIELLKGQTDAVEALREEEALREASAARQAKLEADNLKRLREERAKAAQEAKLRREAEAKAAAAEATQRLALQSQINLLDLQLTTQGDEQKIKMAQERYRLGLELAKDDAMKRAVVEKAYQLEVKKLGEERATREAQQAEERIRKEREAQRAIIDAEIERQQFDIEHRQIREGDLAAETQKQLDALGLRYAQEIIMAEGNQERITELTRRENIERTEIERAQVGSRVQMMEDALDKYGQGFAQAAANALWTSKSIGEAFKSVLDGLAQQSTVEAIMATAKGAGRLAMGDVAGATARFKEAALFASAAAVAGGLSATIPKGGGAGGTNKAEPTSPSGLPQTSSAPTRETAQSSQIVYNVNFGGAVVYDTKRAAEMALTQRIDRRRGEMRGAR